MLLPRAIAVLVLTGLLNLHYRGLLGAALLEGPFWASGYGHALAWKLWSVAAMIVVSALHDFVWGPAAGRARPGSPEAVSLRVRAAWLARVNALLGVVVVIAAVRLARGG